MIRHLATRVADWRYYRARARIEGCVRCGSILVRYVWTDNDTGRHEAHCAGCHIVGQRFAGSVCLDLGHEVDWTRGEVQDRIDRYRDARARNGQRREASVRARFWAATNPDGIRSAIPSGGAA